jgi:hypothetical protein
MAASRRNGATMSLSEFSLSGFDRTYLIFGQAPDNGDNVGSKLTSYGSAPLAVALVVVCE